MQSKRKTLTTALTLAAGFALMLGVTAQAGEKNADPTGTWTWSTPARGGGPDRTNSLVLKMEGEKLVGTLTAPGRGGQANESKVEDGKITGDEISFTITREVNGNKFVSKYSGKLGGNVIKGKVDLDRNGEVTSRDWEAKRHPDKAKDDKK